MLTIQVTNIMYIKHVNLLFYLKLNALSILEKKQQIAVCFGYYFKNVLLLLVLLSIYIFLKYYSSINRNNRASIANFPGWCLFFLNQFYIS